MSDLKRLLLRVALLATLVLAAAGPADAQPWKTSTWKRFGFSASFPGVAKLDSTSTPMPEGDRVISIIGLPTKTGYYAVIVTTMPEFTAERLSDSAMRERIIDGAQKQSLHDINATARTQRPIRLGGLHGREIVADLPDGTEMHTRIYLQENRMYMILSVIEAKNLALATRFLDGFRLL